MIQMLSNKILLSFIMIDNVVIQLITMGASIATMVTAIILFVTFRSQKQLYNLDARFFSEKSKEDLAQE